MDTSQYFSGINSETNDNDLANFYCQQHDQLQQQFITNEPQGSANPNSEFRHPDNQWDQAINCKQELDSYLSYSDNDSSNKNYNSFCDDSINEYEDKPFSQASSATLQAYHNINNSKRPYQITSSGAPLPTWYHPPSIPYNPEPIVNPQFQNTRNFNNTQNSFPPYQQQYQTSSYLSSSTATNTSTIPAPPIPPEHMMNMIHLTNR